MGGEGEGWPGGGGEGEDGAVGLVEDGVVVVRVEDREGALSLDDVGGGVEGEVAAVKDAVAPRIGGFSDKQITGKMRWFKEEGDPAKSGSSRPVWSISV